jgi:hypothetical protein
MSKRYVVVGTDEDGDTGSWNDRFADWCAPWAVYDTETEEYPMTGIRWKWLARFCAWAHNR